LEFAPHAPSDRQDSRLLQEAHLYLISGYVNNALSPSVIKLDLSSSAAKWSNEVTNLPMSAYNLGVNSYKNNRDVFGGYVLSVPSPNSYVFRSGNNPDDISQRTSLGRTLLVKHPRYGYTAGRPMIIIGIESDLKSRRIILELWG
jgi:hypothetical protein